MKLSSGEIISAGFEGVSNGRVTNFEIFEIIPTGYKNHTVLCNKKIIFVSKYFLWPTKIWRTGDTTKESKIVDGCVTNSEIIEIIPIHGYKNHSGFWNKIHIANHGWYW